MTSGSGKGSLRGSPLSNANLTPLGSRRSARLHGGASAPLQPLQQPSPVTNHVSTQDVASFKPTASTTSTEPESKKREREDEPDPVPTKRAKTSSESNNADDSEENADSKASTPRSPSSSSSEPTTNKSSEPSDSLCGSGQPLSTASPPESDTLLSLGTDACTPASDDLSSIEANACAPASDNVPVTSVDESLPTTGLPLSTATSSPPNDSTNGTSKVADTEYQSLSAHVRLEQQQRLELGAQPEAARVHSPSLSSSAIARSPALRPVAEDAFEVLKYLEDPLRQKALVAFHGKRALKVGRDLVQSHYNYRSIDEFSVEDGWIKNAAASRAAGALDVHLILEFMMPVLRGDPVPPRGDSIWWTPGPDGEIVQLKKCRGLCVYNGECKLIKVFTTKSGTDPNRLRKSGELENYVQVIRSPQEDHVLQEEGVYGELSIETNDAPGIDWDTDGPRLMELMPFYQHPHSMPYRVVGGLKGGYDDRLVVKMWETVAQRGVEAALTAAEHRRNNPDWFKQYRQSAQSQFAEDTVVEKTRALPLAKDDEHQGSSRLIQGEHGAVKNEHYGEHGLPEKDLAELEKLRGMFK